MARKKKEDTSKIDKRNEKFNTLKEWYDEMLETYPTMIPEEEQDDEFKTYRILLFDLIASSEKISITYDKNKNTTVMPNE